MELNHRLAEIQRKLKAPKNQFNSFGRYNYRSCEDILEGIKPLLGELTLIISDDIVLIGDRVYVKATATLSSGEHSISAQGLAREPLSKKGMDESQITGCTSSYARKYALNGLFCIDDTKDSDSNESQQQQNGCAPSGYYSDFEKHRDLMVKQIQSGEKTADQIIQSIVSRGQLIAPDIANKIRGLVK